MLTEQKRRLLDLATEPYRRTGRFNYHWARGKLWGDPIFTALLERPILPDGARILDLGCGRGLLAAWLLGAERLAALGEWRGNPAPPTGVRFRGIELMERETICGNQALQPLHGERVALRGGDMRDAELDGADVIAILDALHYVSYSEQDRMLDRIRAAIGTGGLFVTRVGDADGGMRFALSQAVDSCMSFIQGHRLARMWCRPLSAWMCALRERGFAVEAVPMSKGTPFANVMLIARAA
ncbi:MAG: SAM-dependent methyltransferase [Acidiferrobacterales bacterium]